MLLLPYKIIKTCTTALAGTSLSLAALILSLLFSLPAAATHNRAGEITYTQISQYTFEVTVVTYTDSRNMAADRQRIDSFEWGDGAIEALVRCETCQTTVGLHILKNVYTARHTYPGPGRYILRFWDPNRIRDILNIEHSVGVPFYVETELIIDPQRGFNRSPVLLQPPIDYACPTRIFIHNPNAYDPDGDSLSFSLVPPKRDKFRDVPGWFLPPAINGFTINRYTGELIWNYPGQVGIFNIAIRIEEYRNGKLIGYVIRDMQIIVQPCNNEPPKISKIKDTCIEAGQSVNFLLEIKAKDPNKGDGITLTATGGPFLQKIKPAAFNPAIARGRDSVSALFSWDTDCQHIRKEPYRVVFHAIDDDPGTPLSDLKHMDIRIVGPAPQNLQAQAFGNGIQLNWEKPTCNNARAYRIYRRIDSSHWNPAYCETGVPRYTDFVQIHQTKNANTLGYYDDNNGESLSPGLVYCYRITALYLNAGNYEFAEGYASNEPCAQLKKDVPVITHASVRTTSATNGSIYVAWSKPTDLDTAQSPGPYEYRLFRSPGTGTDNFTQIHSYTSPTLSGLTDTTYIDTLINTSGSGYSYKIEFYHTLNGQQVFIGKTITASSIYLNIRRAHYKLELSWQVKVPWNNKYYVVYRKNGQGEWDSIGITTEKRYTDTSLNLGQSYCYLVRSEGSYFTKGFTDPIINFSQQACQSPKDTIPPCAPVMQAIGDCETRTSTISWQPKNLSCDEDVTYYNIYFSALLTNTYQLVGTIQGFNSNLFIDYRQALRLSMAGCYVVTALDSFGNESRYSNSICIENCPIYELPNVFTPNGDEFNDKLRPLSNWRFVDKIEIIIVNRWGQEVYKTTDPEINWDGTDLKSGKKVEEGVYFYNCVVHEIYLNGPVTRVLKGSVHLLR